MDAISLEIHGSPADEALIAAAPDLLRACIVAIDWLADKGVDPEHREAKKIRAAITKATEPC